MSTQLEGVITIGATDRSDEIHEFIINATRMTVVEQPTYGDATESDKAGAQKVTVTITAKNELAAADLGRQLWTAFLTDTAELAFSAQYATGTVGADNPEWSGNLVVTGVQLGTKAGDKRVMTQTFPVNSLTIDTGA